MLSSSAAGPTARWCECPTEHSRKLPCCCSGFLMWGSYSIRCTLHNDAAHSAVLASMAQGAQALEVVQWVVDDPTDQHIWVQVGRERLEWQAGDGAGGGPCVAASWGWGGALRGPVCVYLGAQLGGSGRAGC